MDAEQLKNLSVGLRSEFTAAWLGGQDHVALLDLVHRYQAAHGLSGREVYKVLHVLWRSCGFDSITDSTPQQDNLEFVMEKIWYE